MAEHLETGFLTTRWTQILDSRATQPTSRRDPLIDLCERYRYPVLAYIKRKTRNDDRAEDLCQGFFQQLIEKRLYRSASPQRGKFRTFLLAAVQNYMRNVHRDANRQKRGGGKDHLFLDSDDVNDSSEPGLSTEFTSDQDFDREWANAVFDGVWNTLEKEYDASGQAERFQKLRPTLTSTDEAVPYSKLAVDLGITENGVKSAVSRMRARFRDLFQQHVAQLVENPQRVDEEIAYLIEVMVKGSR